MKRSRPIGQPRHNRFWVDDEGQIRQSLQYLGAGFFPVKTTLIKAAKS